MSPTEKNPTAGESATPSPPPPQPPVDLPDLNQGQAETEDEKLLARPVEATVAADLTSDAWRVFRIMGEFVEGFDTLARVGPAVSVFGSARTTPDDAGVVWGESVGRERLFRRGGRRVSRGVVSKS